jgi:hypothetical protein
VKKLASLGGSVATLMAMGTSQAYAFDLCEWYPFPWCKPDTPPGGGNVPVDEPMTFAVMAIGLVVVGFLMYRRRRSSTRI